MTVRLTITLPYFLDTLKFKLMRCVIYNVCFFKPGSFIFVSVGVCSQALVSISPREMFVHTGAHFKLSCEFTCLSAQHVAQLWRDYGNKVVKHSFKIFKRTIKYISKSLVSL